jgi:transcriptional regulator with XRE-family HTH domain
MPAFKDMLIDAMKTKGLSGLALAKLSGCSQTSVSFATTGKDAPNEETIKKWVEILGISEGDSGDWLSSAALQRAQRSCTKRRIETGG